MADNKSFSWIPFYQELAEKLLEYKDKRKDLVRFVYSLGDCSSFIKKDDGSEVEDIDPFTAFAVFNRQIGDAKRVKIAKSFKNYFSVLAEVPDDFLGIPVMNNQNSTFFYRQTSSEQIPILWNLFEAELNDDKSNLVVAFDSLQKFLGIKWNLTIGMYWIRPYSYMPLDELSRNYLAKIGISVFKEIDLNGKNYLSLLDTIKKKIEKNEIKEKHIPEISHAAWEKTEGRKYFYAGFSFGGSDSQLDRFINDGVWEGSGNKTVNNLIQKVKKGDILILKSSSVKGTKTPDPIPFIRISAIGIVQSDVKPIENSSHYGFNVRYIKVKPKRDFDGNQFGKYRQTLHLCNDKEVIDYVNAIIEHSMLPENIRQYTNILRLKKNIILQGAPGTGKTYNTAALALAICGEQIPEDHGEVMRRYEELQKEGRIGFVTFHQSMDYEDFVEGIKPKTENGMVSYEVEDGIFKVISAKARDNFEDSQKTVEILQKQKDIQERMIDFLSDSQENTTELKTKTGSKFIIKEVTDKNIIIQIPENQVASQITLRMAELRELLENDVELKRVADIKAYFNRQFNTQQDSYTFTLVNEIRKIKTKTVAVPQTELQNYVLIIDEINRGNVSKIFGELITLLEADKRIGGDHPIRVTLPYSKESFGVPSNLYIIGTMNTTDRSVGNIDYAVRRRFAFVTLKADKELVKQNSISLAIELFEAVESFIKKHQIDMDFEDLMVGHSYFFAEYVSELELKWQYEILPLLNEYIKDGIINAKSISSDMTIADFVGEWYPTLAE